MHIDVQQVTARILLFKAVGQLGRQCHSSGPLTASQDHAGLARLTDSLIVNSQAKGRVELYDEADATSAALTDSSIL